MICKRAMTLAQAEVGGEYTDDEIALGVHEYVSANDLMYSPSDVRNGWCDQVRRSTQEWRREQLKLARAAVREQAYPRSYETRSHGDRARDPEEYERWRAAMFARGWELWADESDCHVAFPAGVSEETQGEFRLTEKL